MRNTVRSLPDVAVVCSDMLLESRRKSATREVGHRHILRKSDIEFAIRKRRA